MFSEKWYDVFKTVSTQNPVPYSFYISIVPVPLACISLVVERAKFLHETIDDDALVITWRVYVNIHDNVQIQ
jgi:hypothetical protein